jgi:hypothetical protein
MQPPVHLCSAVGCNERILSTRLMCPRHWFMVPASMRKAIWQAYVPGQEITKDPSPSYLMLAREAVNFVAATEGQPLVPQNVVVLKTLEGLLAKEKYNAGNA